MCAQKKIELSRKNYAIQRCTARLVPLEIYPHLFIWSNVITWTLWSGYMISQIGLAHDIQLRTPEFLWPMWATLFADSCLSFQEVVTAVSIVLGLSGLTKTEARPSYRLTGDSAPSIAVMITCCGEPIEVILNTVKGAAAQDYPARRFCVIVLDDGNNVWLQRAIDKLTSDMEKQNGPLVAYHARKLEHGTRSYFKAGNLQYGIDITSRSKEPSEYIAGLDADMIPEIDWLRRMVPHLISDDGLGIACPPQQYYNVPVGDPLGQQADFSMYFTVQEILNDRLGATMCTGTGYVVRRSALAEIGGWPLAETGEDYMCSAMLSNAGWRIAFVRETLQYGLAPQSLRALLKQRMRWTDAGIEVHRQFKYYLPGSWITSRMTWIQRAVNVLYMLRDYAPVTNILAMILLPIALYPVQAQNPIAISHEQERQLSWLRRLSFVVFAAKKMNTWMVYGHIGLSRVWNFQSNEIWAAPYMAYRCILSLLPAKFNTPTFAVVGTIISPENERSRRHRKPLPSRIQSPDMLMYAVYIIYATIPFLCRIHAYKNPEYSEPYSYPFPGAMVTLLSCVLKASVPLCYMIWPPTVPERGHLVKKDEAGVERPIKDWQGEAGGGSMRWLCLSLFETYVIWRCW